MISKFPSPSPEETHEQKFTDKTPPSTSRVDFLTNIITAHTQEFMSKGRVFLIINLINSKLTEEIKEKVPHSKTASKTDQLPQLSRNQEIKLLQKFNQLSKNGEEKSNETRETIEELIKYHQELIEAISRLYASNEDEFQEFCQEGYIILLKLIQTTEIKDERHSDPYKQTHVRLAHNLVSGFAKKITELIENKETENLEYGLDPETIEAEHSAEKIEFGAAIGKGLRTKKNKYLDQEIEKLLSPHTHHNSIHRNWSIFIDNHGLNETPAKKGVELAQIHGISSANISRIILQSREVLKNCFNNLGTEGLINFLNNMPQILKILGQEGNQTHALRHFLNLTDQQLPETSKDLPEKTQLEFETLCLEFYKIGINFTKLKYTFKLDIDRFNDEKYLNEWKEKLDSFKNMPIDKLNNIVELDLPLEPKFFPYFQNEAGEKTFSADEISSWKNNNSSRAALINFNKIRQILVITSPKNANQLCQSSSAEFQDILYQHFERKFVKIKPSEIARAVKRMKKRYGLKNKKEIAILSGIDVYDLDKYTNPKNPAETIPSEFHRKISKLEAKVKKAPVSELNQIAKLEFEIPVSFLPYLETEVGKIIFSDQEIATWKEPGSGPGRIKVSFDKLKEFLETFSLKEAERICQLAPVKFQKALKKYIVSQFTRVRYNSLATLVANLEKEYKILSREELAKLAEINLVEFDKYTNLNKPVRFAPNEIYKKIQNLKFKIESMPVAKLYEIAALEFNFTAKFLLMLQEKADGIFSPEETTSWKRAHQSKKFPVSFGKLREFLIKTSSETTEQLCQLNSFKFQTAFKKHIKHKIS